ncbi:ubiquitin-like modifier-activating enzyme 1 [Rhipicephalus sanguineus]|uniref:ubiquitin-like modifier-activating enzyme 1 n=1 Tax=Rhipicephalus sanguineus TaxID=34632 RepID=UPI0020C4D11B|nr:ubiquitin-like modifier-activating enzyme 1 [Rhipicephalus sanguineus]
MGALQDTMKGSEGEDDLSPPAKRRRTDEGDASQEADKVAEKLPDIDENFYSRQLYVIGRDAMVRMAQSDVLISGMGGLGVEIAKNVILAGVRSVTIHDEQVCSAVDLSAQYFLSEDTLGENRASACEASLGQLNKYVQVKAHTEPLTMDFLKTFTVVVLTETPLETQQSMAAFTHENNIPLIIADTKGVAGQIFCDFGEKFRVLDGDGEPPRSVLIRSISQVCQGVVTTSHKAPHGFKDGDYVTFSEVRGMTEMNDCPPTEVKVLSPHQFSVMPKYNGITGAGGIATEFKMPKDVKFQPLKESLLNPEFVTCDSPNADRGAQLHLGFQALHAFQEAHERLPRPWDMYEAAEVVQLAKEKNALQAEPLKEVDEKILTLLSCVSSGSLCPMQSVIGSIAAQEVIKACSGKFTPIHQWFYFDAFECLPQKASVPEVYATEFALTRYGAQACVFGSDVQRMLLSQNYLVVGAGAIGCELLKNFAMMGLGACCGCVYVTDSDKVEKSNLNRQFLYRAEDVGHPKSAAATEAAARMNPDLRFIPQEYRVGPETENVYNDRFFEHLNGVASALDNVEGRQYIDRRCVHYRKPLLDSGTVGTKGSVQVVVPCMTESYSCSQDPPEPSVPLCTIKYFPNKIEHTLEWARNEFEGLFKMSAVNAVKYLEDSRFLSVAQKTLPLKEKVALLQELTKILVDERPWVFDDCVEFARLRFQKKYNSDIRQMLRVHPEGELTRKGTPFWSGNRRCPHPIEFDPNNTLHMDYIVAAANLRAAMFGIAQSTDREAITRMLEDVEVPVDDPQGNEVAVIYDSSMPRDGASIDVELVGELLEELPAPRDLEDLTLTALEFDTDDESNFHVDFIVAASNLRAANYNIQPADRLKSKLVAGRIIPAIATTTSLVAGLACLEIYKLVQEHDSPELYRNSFVNLALPYFGFPEPNPPVFKKFRNQEYSFWNCLEIKGELTLSELLEYFRLKHEVEVISVLEGAQTLYDANEPPSSALMKLAVSEVLERVSQAKIDSGTLALTLQVTGKDTNSGEEVEVPEVRYLLRR